MIYWRKYVVVEKDAKIASPWNLFIFELNPDWHVCFCFINAKTVHKIPLFSANVILILDFCCFVCCSSFDVSRENSLVSEEEVANICSDLRRLTVNGETENGYVRVLPSPRVSPDIFNSVPGVIVTSDSDETSGELSTLNVT